MDSRRLARINIPDETRREVLERDEYRCKACGVSRNSGAILHIDHIRPVSKGGSNELANLRVLCRDCNVGKGDLEIY